MDYPLEIPLEISQDDYIEVEILEQAIDRDWSREDHRKTFLIQTAACRGLALILLFFRLKGSVAKESVFVVGGIWAFFAVHFFYSYFSGYRRDYDWRVSHMLEHRNTHTFFTPEKGIVVFYEDRCEFLTNEQRRYFEWSLVQNIKEIRHLFIFVMKRSKEKGLRGFAYMVIPKRCLSEEEETKVRQICRDITERYRLSPWTELDMLD